MRSREFCAEAARVNLVPHPDTPCVAVRAMTVEAGRPQSSLLTLRFVGRGRMSDVRFPPPRAPMRTDELWRHTCFEAFIRFGGGPAYLELNLAPSRQWAAYRFEACRAGMRPVDLAAAPSIAVDVDDDSFELRAAIDLGEAEDVWRLALAAVIEETSGRTSYWALKHPAGKPDFHHGDGFILDLSRES